MLAVHLALGVHGFYLDLEELFLQVDHFEKENTCRSLVDNSGAVTVE